MKNQHLPFLALFMIFFSCSAQNNYDSQIKSAVLAAPEEMREGAKVLGYNDDGELITIRGFATNFLMESLALRVPFMYPNFISSSGTDSLILKHASLADIMAFCK